MKKLNFLHKFFLKSSNIKFHENISSGSQVVPCEQTEMTKLTVAFRSFAKIVWKLHIHTHTYRYCGLISSLLAKAIKDDQRIYLSFDRLISFKVTVQVWTDIPKSYLYKMHQIRTESIGRVHISPYFISTTVWSVSTKFLFISSQNPKQLDKFQSFCPSSNIYFIWSSEYVFSNRLTERYLHRTRFSKHSPWPYVYLREIPGKLFTVPRGAARRTSSIVHFVGRWYLLLPIRYKICKR
jgi:hypothetical protein